MIDHRMSKEDKDKEYAAIHDDAQRGLDLLDQDQIEASVVLMLETQKKLYALMDEEEWL